MQFRSIAPRSSSEDELLSPSTALRRSLADSTHAAHIGGSPIKPPHEPIAPSFDVQPGMLFALNANSNNQLKHVQQHGATKSTLAATVGAAAVTTTHSRRKRASVAHHDTSLAPEPIDYLKLRRTEHSKQALLRNRQVVHEIVSPAPVLATHPQLLPTQSTALSYQQVSIQRELQLQLQQKLASIETQNAAALQTFTQSVRNNGHVESTPLATGIQQLSREQRRVEAQSQQATHELQHLLTDIRNGISLQYKFAPLCRIYARHKLAARWRVWQAYVAWHRVEQQRLEHLAPFAIPIQRVFRHKRGKWARARARLQLAWQQWYAAIALQCWARRQLRARAHERRRETLYAARLQAAWRGRTTRQRVKRWLQDHLRAMLAKLAPTGTLHRLRDVVDAGDAKLAVQVNVALSLVEETHVAVDVAVDVMLRGRKHAAITAQHYTKPIEATRKQLFHAVHTLRTTIREHERAVAAAKDASVRASRAKQAARNASDAAAKRAQLQATETRLAEASARDAMHAAELETREYLRMLRMHEVDTQLRAQLLAARREQTENARMAIEEYTTRFVAAELQRQALDKASRLLEVTKREQLLQARTDQERAERETLVRADERKRVEAQQRQIAAEAADRAHWSRLSQNDKALALQRLELRDQQLRAQQRAADAVSAAQTIANHEAQRRVQQQRVFKQHELERERAARDAMAQAELATRQWVARERKRVHEYQWRNKRETTALEYSTDPVQLAHKQQHAQQLERERRERCLTALEDARSNHVRDQERKAAYFTHCREQQRQRARDDARERKERVLLEAEDTLAQALRVAANRAAAFRADVRRMQVLAARTEQRERDRVLEAKRRSEMHDEELRQRRVAQALAFADRVREKHERHTMREHERVQRVVDTARAQYDEKRRRAKMNLRMMKEDVASIAQHELEREGLRLEQLLWSPLDAAAFAHCVTHHAAMLATNVAVFQDLVPSLSNASLPFELDVDAVRAFAGREHELPLEHVPRKKRKPRRFFYHEFFQDDDALRVPAPAPPTLDEQHNELASQQARARWRTLACHFVGRARGLDAARRGHLEMHNGQFEAASVSLLAAVHAYGQRHDDDDGERYGYDAPAALVRQLARCYFQLWTTTAQHVWLHKARWYFERVSAHVALLASPAFLQELALALEHAGRYRHAAEVLGGIIQCFPRYKHLHNVVFRGAVALFALQLFRQAREYVFHVLDAAPCGWHARELQLLAARVLQLEGRSAKKLCEVAYEDAFRQRVPRTPQHATWREWIRSPETWRMFGDACVAKHEFVLAKDAYQVLLQRQLQPHVHGATAKRLQQIGRTSHQHQHHHDSHEADRDSDRVSDSSDWLRLARVYAALHDRDKTELAISRWLTAQAYRERVLEHYVAWPLVRWRLLGLDIPARVLELRDVHAKQLADDTERMRIAADLRRASVLRHRASRSRVVLAAWQDDAIEPAAAPSVSNDSDTSNTHATTTTTS